MKLMPPALTPEQHDKLDTIAQADDRDWPNRRRVAGFEWLDSHHAVLLLRTPNDRVQSVMPSGRIGSRSPR